MRTIFNILVLGLLKKQMFVLSEEMLLWVKPILQIQRCGILVSDSGDITMCEQNFEASWGGFVEHLIWT